MASAKKQYENPVDVKLYVPDIGDRIVLKNPWKFSLHSESRNSSFREELANNKMLDLNPVYDFYEEMVKKYGAWFAQAYNVEDFLKEYFWKIEPLQHAYKNGLIDYETFEHLRYRGLTPRPALVELPAGTTLHVDRIYIRKGLNEYSSITFRVDKFPEKKNHRFWAKLSDTRNIEGTIESIIK